MQAANDNERVSTGFACLDELNAKWDAAMQGINQQAAELCESFREQQALIEKLITNGRA